MLVVLFAKGAYLSRAPWRPKKEKDKHGTAVELSAKRRRAVGLYRKVISGILTLKLDAPLTRFREFPISIPPLRERRLDIRQLVLHFVEVFSRRMGKRIEQIPEATMTAFSTYDWPGNVRELQNLVERAVIRSDNGVLPNPLPTSQVSVSSAPKLRADLLPAEESDRRIEAPAMTEPQSTDSLDAIQRQHILRVLERTGWVISGPNGAGVILKLHPNTLRSLMDRLGIRHNAVPRTRRGHEFSQPAQ